MDKESNKETKMKWLTAFMLLIVVSSFSLVHYENEEALYESLNWDLTASEIPTELEEEFEEFD